MNQELVEFYLNEGMDNKGRTLHQILQFSDKELDSTHDIIQWLFPLEEKSLYNPDAPLLDDETIEFLLHEDNISKFYTNLEDSFNRILDYLGFVLWQDKNRGNCEITFKPSWPNQKEKWLHPYSHDFLRITRILRSLCHFDLKEYAEALFLHLESIFHTPEGSVIGNSILFWKVAFAPCMASFLKSRII